MHFINKWCSSSACIQKVGKKTEADFVVVDIVGVNKVHITCFITWLHTWIRLMMLMIWYYLFLIVAFVIINMIYSSKKNINLSMPMCLVVTLIKRAVVVLNSKIQGVYLKLAPCSNVISLHYWINSTTYLSSVLHVWEIIYVHV